MPRLIWSEIVDCSVAQPPVTARSGEMLLVPLVCVVLSLLGASALTRDGRMETIASRWMKPVVNNAE